MKYRPSFLMQATMSPEQLKTAIANNITAEELCRRAIKFYSARCVHTLKQKAKRPSAV